METSTNTVTVTVTETKTKRTYQTGHAKNVSNFETLYTFVGGYGEKYNPGKDLLKYPSLTVLKEQAVNRLTEVNTALSHYTFAVTERETEFEGMDNFVTNIALQLKAYEPSLKVQKDLLSYTRKFKGRRAIPKMSQEELEQLSEAEREAKYNSVAQLGYDSRVENFNLIIALLETIPSYQPNEPEFTIEGLRTKLDRLKTKNDKVIQSTMLLSNARILRNETLYTPETGLYDVALKVKAYVRSIFGLNSPQFRQIKNINFTSH